MNRRLLLAVATTLALLCPSASGQFKSLETENLRLIYYGISHEYLVKHVARCFENSLAFHRELFGYTPSEKITVLLYDLADYGNASASVIPKNFVTIRIAPSNYTFETLPSNERMNATLHHELMHVVAGDKGAGLDKLFRSLFFGKVYPTADDPLTLFYSYLTSPRWYAPRWYHEGIATFMETWMSGGLGRAMGGYDEMVFRTKILEDAKIYDMVGLESEGTAIDFQVGSNSYLYGTRFMNYLAGKYGPEQVTAWADRSPGSKGSFTASFQAVFGLPIATAWNEWIETEEVFQNANLAAIRSKPVTPFRPISQRALGSISRGVYDRQSNQLLVGVNYPGQVAHLARIDVTDGSIRRLIDIKGPKSHAVSSLALDSGSRTLFFTTDNNEGWRDLKSIDLENGHVRMLMEDARIGDLSFNPVDRSLWGVRHHLGLSTIVQIPPPYDDWDLVYTLPYGQDVYDLDISPDGKSMTGALAVVTGRQTLVRFDLEKLIEGETEYATLFDFDVSNPESFVFSPDGRYLFGSSYYSGASNVYRYDLEAERMEVLTNAETGFFRPAPVSDDSLIAFRYSDRGFSPVMIANQRAQGVSAVSFLGQRVVEDHPVVRDWVAGSPGAVDLDERVTAAGEYHGLKNLHLASIYPVLQGYKQYVAAGFRVDVADPIRLHTFNLSLAYVPGTFLPTDERLHAGFEYAYRNWTLHGAYNGSDFYDLFGPTKTSRKGYALGVEYDRRLLFDEPRSMDLTIATTGYAGLERLPDYQNVSAPFSRLIAARVSLKYENLRNSLGAVAKEKGVAWTLAAGSNFVDRTLYPRFHAEHHVGMPLAIPHSSVWLRTAAGVSVGKRANPFANFYFGGFGNNWVDHQDERQFQNFYSLPGTNLNAVGGTNFTKTLVEWVLPPLRFRHVGSTDLYLKWARLSLFSSGLATNVESSDLRRALLSAGGQLDLRIMLFSYFRTTLSVGYAVAGEKGEDLQDEFMISFKIL